MHVRRTTFRAPGSLQSGAGCQEAAAGQEGWECVGRITTGYLAPSRAGTPWRVPSRPNAAPGARTSARFATLELAATASANKGSLFLPVAVCERYPPPRPLPDLFLDAGPLRRAAGKRA